MILEQEANLFDDEIVLRQLRYTGMLETVRIRQAGFNVRLTFDEFIHHYRILLPRGLLRFTFSNPHLKKKVIVQSVLFFFFT